MFEEDLCETEKNSEHFITSALVPCTQYLLCSPVHIKPEYILRSFILAIGSQELLSQYLCCDKLEVIILMDN